MTDLSEPEADRLAEIVLAQPGVAGLHRGQFGEVATYLPGRRVSGIRIGDDAVEIHLVVTTDQPVWDVADAVRLAVLPEVGGRAVDLVIGDVATAAELAAAAAVTETVVVEDATIVEETVVTETVTTEITATVGDVSDAGGANSERSLR